jgi:hypothetical protein
MATKLENGEVFEVLLNLVSDYPGCTAKWYARKLNRSQSGIRTNLEKARQYDFVTCIFRGKGSYGSYIWFIVNTVPLLHLAGIVTDPYIDFGDQGHPVYE